MYNKSGNKKKSISRNDLFKFEPLAIRVNRYLANDDVSLNFEGYNDTIKKYSSLQDNHISVAFNLITECNLWFQFFSDLEGYIKLKELETKLDIDYLNACLDIKNPDINMVRVIGEKTRIHKDLVAFLDQICVQKNFFSKAFYHCMNLYAKGIKTMKYKNID